MLVLFASRACTASAAATEAALFAAGACALSVRPCPAASNSAIGSTLLPAANAAVKQESRIVKIRRMLIEILIVFIVGNEHSFQNVRSGKWYTPFLPLGVKSIKVCF